MRNSLDSFDHKILSALVKDGALTNAQLSEVVNLSTSQCSRRRVRLEKEGFIAGYHARLNAEAMGIALRGVVRVNLNSHSSENEDEFTKMLELLTYKKMLEEKNLSLTKTKNNLKVLVTQKLLI